MVVASILAALLLTGCGVHLASDAESSVVSACGNIHMAHRLLIEKGTVVRITQSCSVIIEQQRDEP